MTVRQHMQECNDDQDETSKQCNKQGGEEKKQVCSVQLTTRKQIVAHAQYTRTTDSGVRRRNRSRNRSRNRCRSRIRSRILVVGCDVQFSYLQLFLLAQRCSPRLASVRPTKSDSTNACGTHARCIFNPPLDNLSFPSHPHITFRYLPPPPPPPPITTSTTTTSSTPTATATNIYHAARYGET